jgi:hypothetical protein
LPPVFWSDLRDLFVGHAGQAREHVTQVSKGINVTAAATLDHGIEDGTAFSGVRIADEEPVLFSEGRGPYSVFYEVMPPPGLCRVTTLEAYIKPTPEFVDETCAA